MLFVSLLSILYHIWFSFPFTTIKSNFPFLKHVLYLSDLVVNIVILSMVHHWENCREKVLREKFRSTIDSLSHSISITRFLRPCERLFWPRFRALGWWAYDAFFVLVDVAHGCTGWANRNDENIVIFLHCFILSVSSLLFPFNHVYF
jgi:hypothetical protein